MFSMEKLEAQRGRGLRLCREGEAESGLVHLLALRLPEPPARVGSDGCAAVLPSRLLPLPPHPPAVLASTRKDLLSPVLWALQTSKDWREGHRRQGFPEACQWETQEDLPVVVAPYRIWLMDFQKRGTVSRRPDA